MKKKLIKVKSKTYKLNEKNEFYVSGYSEENKNTGEYISYSYSEDGTVYSHYHVTEKGDIKEIYHRYSDDIYYIKYIGENIVEFNVTRYYYRNGAGYENKEIIDISTTYTEYNDDNQITKKVFKKNVTDEEPFYKEVDFQYDEKGNCIYYAKGHGSYITIISAEYNENNQVILERSRNIRMGKPNSFFDNSDEYIDNFYYENGILVKRTHKRLYPLKEDDKDRGEHHNEKGDITITHDITVTTYNYDENNNLLEKKTIDWQNGIIQSIKQLKYNSLKQLVEYYHKSILANIEKKTIFDDNQEMTIKVYDNQNNMIEYTTIIEKIYEIENKEKTNIPNSTPINNNITEFNDDLPF